MNNNLNSLKKGKYKTMLCKHFETPTGCSYNDRCQFAHGADELKSFSSQDYNFDQNMMNFNQFQVNPLDQVHAMKKLPNPQNYKIVKCKNYDSGNCKYGHSCTFAHGETELRTKTKNSFFNQPNQNVSGSNPQMVMIPGYNMNDVNFPNQNSYPFNFPGDMNQQQMYNYQLMQNAQLMNENQNMFVNPSNINLNMEFSNPIDFQNYLNFQMANANQQAQQVKK